MKWIGLLGVMDEPSMLELKIINNNVETSPQRAKMMQACRRKLERLAPKRIALIKPSALGDIVHALPVATALRQRFPQAELHWVVNLSYQSLLQQHPDLDEVVSFDRQQISRNWLAGTAYMMGFYQQLRRRRYDLVIDLQGLLRTGLMVQMTGARWKIGLQSAREGAGWFYKVVLPDDLWNMHAVDRYWLVADAFGVGDHQKQFRFPPLEKERNTWLAKLAPLPRPWVMMNLGTRWETKRWPVTHFATLGQQLVMTSHGSVILVGGPDEQHLANEFQQQWSKQVVSTVGQTNLRELVAILSLADLVISNDSGPLHVAAALGKPVLSPFTCTSPIRTGPYGQMQGVVRTFVPCAASYRKKCSHLSCMSELTPMRFIPTLEGLLQTWQRTSA